MSIEGSTRSLYNFTPPLPPWPSRNHKKNTATEMDSKNLTKRKRSESTAEEPEGTSKRKRSMSTVAKTLTALVSKTPRIPTQAELDAAVPHSPDMRDDGVWLCCTNGCKMENYVKHYQGAWPFKYLTCKRCDHIFCPECSSSTILTPMHLITTKPVGGCVSGPAQPVWYCRLCRACGLTRRAASKDGRVKFVASCPCGESTAGGGKYLDFFIGSNEEYRETKDEVTQALMIARRLDLHDRVVQQRRLESCDKTLLDSLQPPPADVSQSPHEVPCQTTITEWPLHTPWPEDTQLRVLPGGGFIIDPDSEEPSHGNLKNVAPSAQRHNDLYTRTPVSTNYR